MATFNAVAFLKKHGYCKTTVRVNEGEVQSISVPELTTSLTGKGIKTATTEAQKVSVRLRDGEIDGKKATRSARLEGEQAPEFVGKLFGVDKEEGPAGAGGAQ